MASIPLLDLQGQYRPLRDELLAAIARIAAGTALWLAVLYRMDVSRAFPFLSLTTVVVLAASRWYLREPVTPRRWAGVALIVVGIALLLSGFGFIILALGGALENQWAFAKKPAAEKAPDPKATPLNA